MPPSGFGIYSHVDLSNFAPRMSCLPYESKYLLVNLGFLVFRTSRTPFTFPLLVLTIADIHRFLGSMSAGILKLQGGHLLTYVCYRCCVCVYSFLP